MDTDKLKNIPVVGWVLIVAGAAFGGAMLHSHRLIGALLGGGAAFAYEYSQAPCCASCAQGAGCGGTTTTTTTTTAGVPKNTGIVPPQLTGIAEPSAAGTGALASQQGTSTTPLPTSNPGDVRSSFDPLSLWSAPRFNAQETSGSKSCKGCA